ncbi:glutaminyl-peptide cyclotransferase [Pseudohyphozyma bogoriensis]|nr:glutaminyl-peptide cyclotransferase [Pseudohyphozyma bogoriensis]
MLLPSIPPTLVLLLALTSSSIATRPRPNILKRKNPTYAPLADEHLPALAKLTDPSTHLDHHDPMSSLSSLLVPRPAGSRNLLQLQEMMQSHFNNLGWTVQKDSFTADTPIGPKEMTNLVFLHDPSAPLRFLLSAHLDSKWFPNPPESNFIGATDSSAPCAILMDVAEALTPWLNARDQSMKEGEKPLETLGIVLFDGEEAFHDWTHTDSIYGAKHLVKVWSQPNDGPSPNSPKKTPLSQISHLVLLDLLGAPSPVIRSWFTSTGWLFDEFQQAEARLGLAGLLWDSTPDQASYQANRFDQTKKERTFFVGREGVQSNGGGIEDDHLPFLAAGVPIVHMIPLPFPSVWHTIRDDASALDYPTIKAWALIVRLTVAEYLGLAPPEAASGSDGKAKRTGANGGELLFTATHARNEKATKG